MRNLRFFDLETCAAPAEELKPFEPEFTAPSNFKDPLKIEKNIEEQRAKWYETAATSPTTGRILSLAICDGDPEKDLSIYDWAEPYDGREGEAGVVQATLDFIKGSGMGSQWTSIGWSVKEFDLPFLVKRAWALGLKVPLSLVPTGKTRFYWPSWIIDLRDVWGLGEQHPHGSLDVATRFMGFHGKRGEGKDYARLWFDPDTRQQAYDYQKSEMECCVNLAKAFGLLDKPSTATLLPE